MARNEITGMRELEKALKELGKVPQRAVTKAAKGGGRIALKAAKAKAPFLTGKLKRGIIMKAEKRTKPGKKVYDVMLSPHMNDDFVKMSADGTKRYYYPASMEYGFFARNGRYIPGDHYLRDALENNAATIEKKVVEIMSKEVDKALQSKGG